MAQRSPSTKPSRTMFIDVGDKKDTAKKLCDKYFAERSGELSGAVCLKTLVLPGNDRQPPRNLFGAVRAIFLAL